jgi:hypothetical protein
MNRVSTPAVAVPSLPVGKTLWPGPTGWSGVNVVAAPSAQALLVEAPRALEVGGLEPDHAEPLFHGALPRGGGSAGAIPSPHYS